MKISRQTMEKMKQFARQQAPFYLEDAAMTYMEQLRLQTGRAKRKLESTLSKFKSRSDTAIEAENDMLLYMSDYMNDLMERGLSENEAFEQAKAELAFKSETEKSATLEQRFADYYKNRDPELYEVIGLFYGAFVILGLAFGTLIGFITGGGLSEFLTTGWINTTIGTGVGLFIGIGLGLLSNAIILLRK